MGVHSVICGNLISTNQSNMVTVNLKGLYWVITVYIAYYANCMINLYPLSTVTVPETLSVIECIPYYSDSDNNILRVITTFNTAV